MKKTTKPASVAPSKQEECGVWLDTAELHRKKQKQLVRPISKLLNPLAHSGGYSVAVGLSFTQTKLSMPVTRQSSISSFFSPHRKEPCVDLAETSATSSREVYTKTKRKHGMGFELPATQTIEACQASQLSQENEDADFEDADFEEAVRRSLEDTKHRNTEQHFLHLIGGYQSEEEEPAEKRRPFSNGLLTTETQEEYSKDPQSSCSVPGDSQAVPETVNLMHWDNNTQDSQGHHVLTHRRLPPPESLESEVGFRALLLLDRHTSTQRKPHSARRSSAEGRGKKNSPSATVRNMGRSPRKPKLDLWSPAAGRGENNSTTTVQDSRQSHLKQRTSFSPILMPRWREKSRLLPQKAVREFPLKEAEGDTLAMLFTQDSEGFRVIAHRGLQSRSPLKDHTNLTKGRDRDVPAVASLEEEDSQEEPEMMFTQDSQGNMVIKH